MSQVQGGGQQQQQHRRFQSVPDGADSSDGMGDQPDPSAHANGAAQANGAQVNGHAPEADADDEAPSAGSREPV